MTLPNLSHVQFSGNRVYTVDGYRLACDTDTELSVPVPFMALPETLEPLKLFGDQDVAIHLGDESALITDGVTTLTFRLPDGEPFKLDNRLIAKRVETSELFASESTAVSCLLSADFVEAKRLSVALSDIDEIRADEVINLKPKKRSLFRFLLASGLRSWWLRFTAPEDGVVDAEYKQAQNDSGAIVNFEAKSNSQSAA